jgi:hypothetical protein
MSASTSRKYAWIANSIALQSINRTKYFNALDDITSAASESDFKKSTLEVIKIAELDLKKNGTWPPPQYR